MNIYKEAMNALKNAGLAKSNDVVELSSRRLLKDKYDMLQNIIDENDGIDCKIDVTNSGAVSIRLVFDYFSTNRMADMASIFDFSDRFDVSATDDERTEFLIEFPTDIS